VDGLALGICRNRYPCTLAALVAGSPRLPPPRSACKRRRGLRCRSSVVEHSLGKGEVDSSILSGSTRKDQSNQELPASHAEVDRIKLKPALTMHSPQRCLACVEGDRMVNAAGREVFNQEPLLGQQRHLITRPA
jgi:hypothetical protein